MDIRPLSLDGSWVIDVPTFGDDRGEFREAFRRDKLAHALGRRTDIVQANFSRSARGVVRGVHFADVPLGQAKYVQVVAGRILDVIVDLRTGSPTFGHHEAVELDARTGRAVFLAEGLGHAFQALEEDTAVMYLVSDVYRPQHEHGVNPCDPTLALPWPIPVTTAQMSAKDAEAPGLDESREAGMLPSWDVCREHYVSLALPVA